MVKSIKKIKQELKENTVKRKALEELGLLEEVEENGWFRLSSTECGKVGALISIFFNKKPGS